MSPYFRFTAGGLDITPGIAARLTSMVLSDVAGSESDTLTLSLENADERLESPAIGAELDVWLGYDGRGSLMGRFIVDEVGCEGPPCQVTVRARGAPFMESRSYGSLQTQKTRSFENLTLGQLVSQIAGEHGLEAVVGSTVAGKALPHIDQTNESDIHLLLRLARDLDLTIKPAVGRLIVLPSGQGVSASGAAILPVLLRRQDVESYRLGNVRRTKFGKVTAYWRDTAAGQDVAVTVGDAEPERRIRHVFATAGEAADAANAMLSTYARGSGTVEVTTAGNPAVVAEGLLILRGFPLGIDGIWRVKRVDHKIDEGGYKMTVEGESIASGAAAGTAGTASGGGDIDAGELGPVLPLIPSVP